MTASDAATVMAGMYVTNITQRTDGVNGTSRMPRGEHIDYRQRAPDVDEPDQYIGKCHQPPRHPAFRHGDAGQYENGIVSMANLSTRWKPAALPPLAQCRYSKRRRKTPRTSD